MKSVFLCAVFSLVFPSALVAQSGFFEAWEERVRKDATRQPAWPVPVVGVPSNLYQLFRTDFSRQYTPAHTTTWSYGYGKGLNLIPFAKTEVDINIPPYLQRNSPGAQDGFGDVSFAAKYRPFSGNDKHGNYSTVAQVAFSVPTGSYKNGTAVSTITPTIAGGKGFGRFALQSAVGAVLPTSSVSTVGRTIQWNTVAQYKVGKYLWPELEVNSSYFFEGANDGKNQTFLTPGFMFSKIKLRKDPKDRMAVLFGGGMQFATSSFHTYDHNLVFTTRFSF